MSEAMSKAAALSDNELQGALKQAEEAFGLREQYGIRANGLDAWMGELDAEASRRGWVDGERPA